MAASLKRADRSMDSCLLLHLSQKTPLRQIEVRERSWVRRWSCRGNRLHYLGSGHCTRGHLRLLLHLGLPLLLLELELLHHTSDLLLLSD